MAERPAKAGDCIATLTVKRLIPDVAELKAEASDWRLQVTFGAGEVVRDLDNLASLPVTDLGEITGHIPGGCGQETVITVRADMLGQGESNPFSGLSHFWIAKYKANCPSYVRGIELPLSFKMHTSEARKLSPEQAGSFNSSLVERRVSSPFNRIQPARAQLYSHVTFNVICDLELTCFDGEVMQNSVGTG